MLVRVTGELLCNVIRFRDSCFGKNTPEVTVFFSLHPVGWHAIFTSLFTDNFHFDHLIKAGFSTINEFFLLSISKNFV